MPELTRRHLIAVIVAGTLVACTNDLDNIHLWTPRGKQVLISNINDICRMLPSVRPPGAALNAAGLYGSSRTGSKTSSRTLKHHVRYWFSGPV